MTWNSTLPEQAVVFTRLSLNIRGDGSSPASQVPQGEMIAQTPLRPLRDRTEYAVLVINASREMAKEITIQLSLEIPGCTLMYAPTIQLAAWMLKRRTVDLIVSDAILPDGSVTMLREVFEQMEAPPDLVVVGGVNERGLSALNASGYAFSEIRRDTSRRRDSRNSLGSQIEVSTHAVEAELPDPIKNLGADIRNDLNNPLQEIVAMVFVARAHGEAAAGVSLALGAIEKAAQNMAGVVRGLEEKIRQAVGK